MDFVLAHYLQTLTEEQRSKLASYYEGQIPTVEDAEKLPLTEDILRSIHPSWLEPIIHNFSYGDKRAFLSVLTEEQSKTIKEELRIEEPLKEPSSLLTKFLLQTLAKALLEDAPPLAPLIPKAPLNELLNLTEQQLEQVCSFLGLHDLASDIKKIIQSDKLKRIEEILSADEKKHLKELLKTKEIVTFGSLNLQNWDGKAESLREVLRARGLNRLAKALYNACPTLIWLLTHRMEKSHAEMLQKLCVDPKNVMAQEALQEQVMTIIKEYS
ncbi:MAG: hypothetical protein SNF33_02905 [Candidatus Algichlamydia australiensis]|nr:hypothetical protein [Chlamydiales bacterium]